VRKDNNIRRAITKIQKIINAIEDGFVVLCLSAILIIAIIQIILRNFFNSGLIWGDSLLSVLVLWLGLAGSIVASRQGKHINIDVLSQYASDRYKRYIKKIASLFAATICMIVSYYSFLFVSMEYDVGELAFASVPAWLVESIIPVAFFIMGIRYFLEFVYYDPAHYSPVKNNSTNKPL